VKTSRSLETGESVASRYFFAVSSASFGRPAAASASIAATAATPAAMLPLSDFAKAFAASRFAPVAAFVPSSESRRTAAARPAGEEGASLTREGSAALAAAVRSATRLKARTPGARAASDARGASKRASAEESRAARPLFRKTIPPQMAPATRMAPPAITIQRVVSDRCVATKSRASVSACWSWSVFICCFVSRFDMLVSGLASAESGERRILVIEKKPLGLLLKVVVDRGALEARERVVVHPDDEAAAALDPAPVLERSVRKRDAVAGSAAPEDVPNDQAVFRRVPALAAQRVEGSFRHTDAVRLLHQPQRFFFRFPDFFAGLAFFFGAAFLAAFFAALFLE